MSDDKKFTLDDILAEYENKDHNTDGVKADETSAPADDIAAETPQETVSDVHADTEYDDYEDGEEQDFSVVDAGEPMLRRLDCSVRARKIFRKKRAMISQERKKHLPMTLMIQKQKKNCLPTIMMMKPK